MQEQIRSVYFFARVHYVLRIGAAMCFIGHGAFGIITKAIWCNYFAVFGIGHDWAYRLMPVLGCVDILLGLLILVYPMRILVLWLVVWALITATLRPLSGEPFLELIERAGNFGTPLALLMLAGGMSVKKLFKRINISSSSSSSSSSSWGNVRLCLRLTVFLLFLGHGWLNLLEKQGLLTQYINLGLSRPAHVAQLVGVFEVLAALLVLIRPYRPFLLFLFIWKMTTELFYPHYEIFEWIERGGSYCAILALYWMQSKDTILDSRLRMRRSLTTA